MEHLRRLGCIDIAVAVGRLSDLAPYWPRDTLRQSAPGSPHLDTEVIYLRMPPVVDRAALFESLKIVDWQPLPDPVLEALMDEIAWLAGLPLARVMLVKLKPGGVVMPHVDEGPYAAVTCRYHLALTSNPDCRMWVGGESAVAAPGEVWWFDKHAPHAVRNMGPTDRVHMIADCWAPVRPAN